MAHLQKPRADCWRRRFRQICVDQADLCSAGSEPGGSVGKCWVLLGEPVDQAPLIMGHIIHRLCVYTYIIYIYTHMPRAADGCTAKIFWLRLKQMEYFRISGRCAQLQTLSVWTASLDNRVGRPRKTLPLVFNGYGISLSQNRNVWILHDLILRNRRPNYNYHIACRPCCFSQYSACYRRQWLKTTNFPKLMI